MISDLLLFSLFIDVTITIGALFFSPKAQFEKHLIIKYAPTDSFLSYDIYTPRNEV